MNSAIFQASGERQICLALILTLFTALSLAGFNLIRRIHTTIAMIVGIPHTIKAPSHPSFRPWARGILIPDANDANNPIEVE
ncbi:hypothetical protein D3C76_1396310 [compost metagenome]